MIIGEQKINTLYSSGKIEDSTDMEIDPENIGLLMNFLSKNIYSDAIGSLIRESVSNSWDATTISGKKIPIIVKLGKNEQSNWEFSVEDKALGLDKEDVQNIIKKYLKSTKRLDNSQLGGLGLGFKSPLAYKSSFTFIGTKDGWKRTWIMYEGEFGNKIDLINEEESKEENGVKIIISVDNYDRRDFSSKIRQQLSYFSNVYIIDEYDRYNNEGKIYENSLFKWSENQDDNKMHIALGEVYYSLDFKKLGIPDIYIPVAIKIGLDEGIIPTLNRESFMMTPQTKELILNKIKLVSEWFVNKYNENVREFGSLLEAWEYINNSDREVILEGKKFNINELEKFSSVKCAEPKVKGAVLISPVRYKTLKDHLLKGYSRVGQIKWNGRMSNNGGSEWYLIDEYLKGNKSIIINNTLSGFFREYVKTLPYKHFVKKVPFYYDLKYYKQTLSLKDYPKSQWREVIKEWQTVKEQFCKELFTDGSKLHLEKDFLDYKEKNKTSTKYSGTYKRLNKEKGQVTITEYVKNYHGNDLKQFKTVVDIDKLHRNKFLTLIFELEEAELCKEYAKTFKLPHLRFWMLGKKDYKIISLLDIKNVKMFAKTKKEEIRDFKKITTACLFSKVLQEFEIIYYNAPQLIQESMSNLYDAKIALKHYIDKYSEVKNNGLSKDIIANCKEYDLTLWKEYELLLNANKDLSFLKWVNKPSSWSDENIQFTKFINEELLIRKLTNRYDLSQFEIKVCEKVDVEEELLETV